jgi:hypothetical protein
LKWPPPRWAGLMPSSRDPGPPLVARAPVNQDENRDGVVGSGAGDHQPLPGGATSTPRS